jgi:hypothetical protein
MSKKEKILEDTLILAIILALVFAGLYLYSLFSPKPLYQEGILGTMASQLDLIVQSINIFQATPSLENYLILKSAVSRAYGITLPAYAAYQRFDIHLSEEWGNLGVFLNQLELELKNRLIQNANQEQAWREIKEDLSTLKDPLSQLQQKIKDWSQDISNEEKARLFWEQLDQCQKAVMALTP